MGFLVSYNDSLERWNLFEKAFLRQPKSRVLSKFTSDCSVKYWEKKYFFFFKTENVFNAQTKISYNYVLIVLSLLKLLLKILVQFKVLFRFSLMKTKCLLQRKHWPRTTTKERNIWIYLRKHLYHRHVNSSLTENCHSDENLVSSRSDNAVEICDLKIHNFNILLL